MKLIKTVKSDGALHVLCEFSTFLLTKDWDAISFATNCNLNKLEIIIKIAPMNKDK